MSTLKDALEACKTAEEQNDAAYLSMRKQSETSWHNPAFYGSAVFGGLACVFAGVGTLAVGLAAAPFLLIPAALASVAVYSGKRLNQMKKVEYAAYDTYRNIKEELEERRKTLWQQWVASYGDETVSKALEEGAFLPKFHAYETFVEGRGIVSFTVVPENGTYKLYDAQGTLVKPKKTLSYGDFATQENDEAQEADENRELWERMGV